MKKQHQMEKTELEKKLETELAAEACAKEAEAAGEPVPAPEPEKPELPELEAVTADRDFWKDQALRARAEVENFRKRAAREVDRIRKRAAENLIRDLLPVLDHLELAAHHGNNSETGLQEGVELVLKQFREVLTNHGVEEIPAGKQPFDPTLHEAVMGRLEPGVPPGMVVETCQKGYSLGGQVLRPAKAVVSVARPEAQAEAAPDNAAPSGISSDSPEQSAHDPQ